MPLEPPGADVSARRDELSARPGGDPPGDEQSFVRLAFAVAAAALAATSTGDVIVLAVLLGLAAGNLVAGTVALLAAAAVVARWGSASLDGLAGAQAVLGPAGFVGTVIAAGSAWCAAVALVLVPPPVPDGMSPIVRPLRLARTALPSLVTAIAFGLAAADVVAGPGRGGAVWARVVASVVMVAAAVAVPPAVGVRFPDRAGRVAVLLGLAALVLAVVA